MFNSLHYLLYIENRVCENPEAERAASPQQYDGTKALASPSGLLPLKPHSETRLPLSEEGILTITSSCWLNSPLQLLSFSQETALFQAFLCLGEPLLTLWRYSLIISDKGDKENKSKAPWKDRSMTAFPLWGKQQQHQKQSGTRECKVQWTNANGANLTQKFLQRVWQIQEKILYWLCNATQKSQELSGDIYGASYRGYYPLEWTTEESFCYFRGPKL